MPKRDRNTLCREAWEWVCAFSPAGEPAWSHDLDVSIPLLSVHRWLGIPELVNIAGLRRYWSKSGQQVGDYRSSGRPFRLGRR